MKLRLYDGVAPGREIVTGCVVVCTDNGTPIAVASDYGQNVGLRTAAHPGFGETLRILGIDAAAPAVETVSTAHGQPGASE